MGIPVHREGPNFTLCVRVLQEDVSYGLGEVIARTGWQLLFQLEGLFKVGLEQAFLELFHRFRM